MKEEDAQRRATAQQHDAENAAKIQVLTSSESSLKSSVAVMEKEKELMQSELKDTKLAAAHANARLESMENDAARQQQSLSSQLENERRVGVELRETLAQAQPHPRTQLCSYRLYGYVVQTQSSWKELYIYGLYSYGLYGDGLQAQLSWKEEESTRYAWMQRCADANDKLAELSTEVKELHEKLHKSSSDGESYRKRFDDLQRQYDALAKQVQPTGRVGSSLLQPHRVIFPDPLTTQKIIPKNTNVIS